MPRRRGAADFGGGPIQAGAMARAERLREWRALAAGGAVCTADVAMALRELEELQAEMEGDVGRYREM